MLSPQEFMMYATPLVVLVAHLVSEELAKGRAAKLATQTKNSADQLSRSAAIQTQRVVSTVINAAAKNAEDSANLTVAKMEEPGGKMDVIHGLTNGTLSVANSKIEALQLELDRLKETQKSPMSNPQS